MGDRRDIESLYRENFQKVYNYAYYRLLDPTLAEDLTSVVFTKVSVDTVSFRLSLST